MKEFLLLLAVASFTLVAAQEPQRCSKLCYYTRMILSIASAQPLLFELLHGGARNIPLHKLLYSLSLQLPLLLGMHTSSK